MRAPLEIVVNSTHLLLTEIAARHNIDYRKVAKYRNRFNQILSEMRELQQRGSGQEIAGMEMMRNPRARLNTIMVITRARFSDTSKGVRLCFDRTIILAGLTWARKIAQKWWTSWLQLLFATKCQLMRFSWQFGYATFYDKNNTGTD
ncbi:hypothetical protein niasHT_031934 [Heterodera trifolii]|uniref:Uncharacterized protein n=1 Tax=Heterodera trifolii TaxID=157864 RepID=A0ABD2I196_9BILA